MASINAYPPFVHHPSSSKPLSTNSAHTILTTFLHLANLDPAYRPDSTLSERGPESNSSAGNPNLTLHHLNRIKLGLEGTNLGEEDLAADFFGKAKKATDGKDSVGGKKRKWQDRDTATTLVKTGIPEVISTADEDVDAILTVQHTINAHGAAANGEGWQDREDFELAQDDEDVDMNSAQRDPAAATEMEEGIGEEIMEGKTGKMINVHEELEQKNGAVEMIRAGDVVDAQPKHAPATGGQRPLTEQEKEERKRLKKIRSGKEKKSAKMGQVKAPLKEPSQMGNDNEDSKEASARRKRKRSKVEKQS